MSKEKITALESTSSSRYAHNSSSACFAYRNFDALTNKNLAQLTFCEAYNLSTKEDGLPISDKFQAAQFASSHEFLSQIGSKRQLVTMLEKDA
jgi:hypothetical protein